MRTWELINLLESKSAIGRKWMYKNKTRLVDIVNYYKVRLVAKEFTLDYEKTFVLVTWLSCVSTLIFSLYLPEMAIILNECKELLP